MDDTLFDYLLRLGDDCLVLGQRLGEWSAHAPTIEMDLSLSNLALDLIGQATLFLGLAGEVEGAERDADRLAFHRDADDYRNCLLVEQPNGDFGQTIARHLLFSMWHELRLGALAGSCCAPLAAIAAKAVKETRYHSEFAADWTLRLGDGTTESRQRMIDGFDWHWRFVDELFATDAVDRNLASRDITGDPAVWRHAFDDRLKRVLNAAGLPLPRYPRPVTGGRRGRHTEHLGHVLAVMQHIPRSYPTAKW